MTRCPNCGATHAHRYIYCQSCDYVMNPSEPASLMIQIPRHFYLANRDGYTQRELLAENDAYHFEKQDR